jgi:hypothetical protein
VVVLETGIYSRIFRLAMEPRLISDAFAVRELVYAVPMRYDELLDAEPLDRESTVELIDEVDRWARNVLGQ